MLMNQILQEIENQKLNTECVFLDFFDTIVHRKCHPDTIKQIWSKKSLELISIDVSAFEFYKIRIESELYLMSKNIEREYSYERLCEEIYGRLIMSEKILPHEYSLAEFFAVLINVELEVEKEHQYLDSNMKQLIKELLERNVKIVIVSDFYLGRKHIEQILKYHGLDNLFDNIFISCDYSSSKRSGSLYEIVAKNLNVNLNQCLMIGDNNESDYIKAKEKGCHAIYNPYSISFKQNTMKTVVDGLYKLYEATSFDYRGYAFGIYNFVSKLYLQIKKNKEKNIFFLSREGQFLKESFDLYLKLHNDREINTYYLYASRVATFVPSLSDIDHESFHNLFRQFKHMSISTFLKNLGFSMEQQEEVKSSTYLNFEEDICNFNCSNEYSKLITNETFIKIYNEHISEQKTLFGQYINSFGVDLSEGIILVDVGWKGTMQDNIYNYFEKKIPVKGYYFGYNELGNCESNNKKVGLMFSAIPYKTKYYSVWSADAGFLEKILYASHPSTKYYYKENESIKPYFENFESEKGIYELVRPVQKDILEILPKIDEKFRDIVFSIYDLETVFADLFLKSICHLGKHTYKIHYQLELNHFENFGAFKSAEQLYSRSKKQYIKIVVSNLKNIRKIFTFRCFTGVCNYMLRFKCSFLIPFYAKVVYHQEFRHLKRE